MGLFFNKKDSRITKKDLYLHIGLAKTGTTTIQNYFSINQDRLQELGILYPLTGQLGGGHSRIAALYTGKEKHTNKLKSYVANSEPLKFRDNILYELEMSYSAIDSVLISAELFGESSEEQIKLFIEHYKDYFNIKVIIYLRRQDFLSESLVGQAYKVKMENFAKDRYLTKTYGILNFKELITKWESRVGKNNLIIREYFQGEKNPLINSFNKILSLKSDGSLLEPTNLNLSVGRDCVEYLQNHTKLKFGEELYFKAVAALQKYNQANSTKAEYSKYYSPSERQKILNHYLEENLAISKKHFSGKLFRKCPDIDLTEPWSKYPGLSDDQVKKIETFLQESGLNLKQVRK